MTYQTFKQQIRQSLQDAFGSDVSIILQYLTDHLSE